VSSLQGEQGEGSQCLVKFSFMHYHRTTKRIRSDSKKPSLDVCKQVVVGALGSLLRRLRYVVQSERLVEGMEGGGRKTDGL